MNSELVGLKELIYDTLTLEDSSKEEKDIVANQNMGVQLTSSMKKEGVTIIQMQNVINKRVTINLVKALQLIDKLQDNSNRVEISHDKVHEIGNNISEMIEYLSNEVSSLKDFDIKMRQLLIENLSKKGLSNKAIAKRLDCHPVTVGKIKSGVDDLPLLETDQEN